MLSRSINVIRDRERSCDALGAFPILEYVLLVSMAIVRASVSGTGSDGQGRNRNFSESKSERQIRNHMNPSLRTGIESEQGKINWNKVWDSSKGCTSFFFKNFPESLDLKTLFMIFKEVDRVGCLYISKG